MDAGLKLILTIAEHARSRHDGCLPHCKEEGMRVIGPNSFGVISPGKVKSGFMAHKIFTKGSVE